MLRTVLSLLALGWLTASVFSGCQAKVNQKEAKAIAEIQKLVGEIRRDEEKPDQPVIRVNFMSSSLTDDGLEHLKGLTQLHYLWASITPR